MIPMFGQLLYISLVALLPSLSKVRQRLLIYNKELHQMTEQSKSPAVLQGKDKSENFPPEIIELLKILARIEARRQARLRAQKGCE